MIIGTLRAISGHTATGTLLNATHVGGCQN